MTNNDVVLRLGNLKTGSTYTVKVEHSTADVFGIGGYRLVVDAASNPAPPAPGSTKPVADAHSNDTFGRATNLIPAKRRRRAAKEAALLR